jgi:hypothetical protein
MSLLHPITSPDDIARQIGHIVVKTAEDALPALSLAGRLYLSSSGWLLLSVPNAFVQGMFDALQEPGVELPTNSDGKFNAHISVMRPEEIEALGGPSKITERGHSFRYNINKLKTVNPAGWAEMGKVWFVEVYSPELQTLRKTYGLDPLPKYPFHITVAVRRKNVLYNTSVSKTVKVGDSHAQLQDKTGV